MTPAASAAEESDRKSSLCERLGNAVDETICGAFYKVGTFVAFRPKLTICLSILLAVVCGTGFVTWTIENRADELFGKPCEQ